MLGSSRSSPACSTSDPPARYDEPDLDQDRPSRSGSQRDDAPRPSSEAQYLARMWLANLAAGVNLSLFYDWRDDGDDPREREHRFGTVRRDLMPKPSFEAARTLSAALDGFTFRHRLRMPARTTGGSCSSGATPLASPWSPGAADPTAVEADRRRAFARSLRVPPNSAACGSPRCATRPGAGRGVGP